MYVCGKPRERVLGIGQIYDTGGVLEFIIYTHIFYVDACLHMRVKFLLYIILKFLGYCQHRNALKAYK